MKTIKTILEDILFTNTEYSIDDVENILNYIVQEKKKELGIDFSFETIYDDGGTVKHERNELGLLQVEIGYKGIWDIIEAKELKKNEKINNGIEVQNFSKLEERNEFIELILSLFHELRHVKQIDNITDHIISNDYTLGLTREIIINECFPGLISIYNYEQSLIEIDAMKTSLEETVEFFMKNGIDISPDEVFYVMRERELRFLKYDISMFGNSYDSAIIYFEQIYNNIEHINGLFDSLKLLSEDQKQEIFYQCQDLMDMFNIETNVDKKLNILAKISLRLKPELSNIYPLSSMMNETFQR